VHSGCELLFARIRHVASLEQSQALEKVESEAEWGAGRISSIGAEYLILLRTHDLKPRQRDRISRKQ